MTARERPEDETGQPPRRTIAVLTSGRQDWGTLRSTSVAIRDDPRLRLRLIVGGMHLSPRYGETVRFVRDPMDMDSEPGMGVRFDRLDEEARDLILRFIRKRPPLFYDE